MVLRVDPHRKEKVVIIKPAHSYPYAFSASASMIEFVCACHSGLICGSAARTGLTVEEEWPVYALHSYLHPEYNDIRVALSPNGFVLLPVYMIVEHEQKPYVTPFTARILVGGKEPYDFDPHPSAWWMYTRGDLVRAVNKQVPGIRYVAPNTFQVCLMLAGLRDEGTCQPDPPPSENTHN